MTTYINGVNTLISTAFRSAVRCSLTKSVIELIIIMSSITKPKKRVLVSYGVDIDAIAGWLGSYKGEDSTSDISRGYFAGTEGVRRLLKLFDKYHIKASWFIPGHSLE